MVKVKYKDKLEVKLTIAFVLIITIAVAVLSTMMYRNSYNLLVNNLGNRSIKLAEAVAKKINVKEHNKLKTATDEETEIYNKISEQLLNMKEASGAESVYTMRKNENGQYIYVADGESSNSENKSHIGDVEKEVEIGFQDAYKGNVYYSKEIGISSWGTLVSAYYPLKDTNNEVVGFVGVDYDVEKEYNEFRKFRIELIIISLGVLVITSIFGVIISKNMSKPIIKVTELLNKTASLDLAHDSSYDELLKCKDEIGVMVNSLFSTREALRELVTSILGNSKNINTYAETLSLVSHEMTYTVENVSASIENVANGTSIQAEDLLNVTSKLDDFGGHLSNIVKRIKDIHTDATEIKSMAGRSGNDMENLVKNLDNIIISFNNLVTKISGVGEDINKINDITNIIKGIADQTNLLALNASIEAARAGEAGRGFDVVAGEIRKLAEQSKDSSESINGLINSISKNTNIMLQATDVMDGELRNEVSIINNSVDSFKKIIQSIDEIIPKIDEVSKSAINIDKEKDSIIEKVEVVSAAAEEISSSTEEITDSSEEMNSAAEEVTSSAKTLSNMTKEMMEQVDKFKL
jgi:Methyl-accepting chemotaxis protein